MDISKCRVCSSTNLEDCIDLGDQPWCNDFITKDALGTEKTYPLVCAFCNECSTLQVKYTVPKEIMYADHTYLSGSTKTMVNHFQGVSDFVCDKLIGSKGLVVDIGSNDGTLLSTYKNNDMDVYGVEACAKTAKIANKNGIFTEANYFNKECADKILSEKGPAKVISAANVFYHVEDLHSIVEGIEHLLCKDGVFVVQASYLPNLLKTNAFDIMYHEHLLYYRIENLNYLLSLHSLEVFDVQEASVHGGSIVVFACHKGERTVTQTVIDMIATERAEGYHEIEKYHEFNSNIQKMRTQLQELVAGLETKGKTIFAYGAPAKGTVMLNYCSFTSETISKAAEVNSLKFGRYIPCTNIPIEDEETLEEPDYYLLLSWNFVDEFCKSDAYQSGKRKFIIPLPEPKIISKNKF